MAYTPKMFKDLTHLPRSAMIQFRNDWLLKHPDPALKNASAYLYLKEDNTKFKDLANFDANGNRVGWEYDNWGSAVLRRTNIGRIRLAISIVLNCLYNHCPVDTGYGITNGIRYEYFNNKNSASIKIGFGIADYLVHQSYPMSAINAAQNSSHIGWIDDAVSEARAECVGLGFKVEKGHLRKGKMSINIVPFYSGNRSIKNIIR